MIKYVKDFSFPTSAGFTASAGKQMVKGYARGGQPKAQAKVGKVMSEYGKGELHSGSKSGPLVKNPKQAIAIALSEARKAGAKMPVKKAEGGPVKEPKSSYPKVETPSQKKIREQKAQEVMERASKHAEELAKGPGYESGGRVKPAVMPGKSGTAGRPASTGLARAAEMSGRTMPTTGRPAMKKGGKVKNYADGGYVSEEPGYEEGYAGAAVMPGRSGVTGRPNLTGLGRAAQMSGRTMPTTGRPSLAPPATGATNMPMLKKGGKVRKYADGGYVAAPEPAIKDVMNSGFGNALDARRAQKIARLRVRKNRADYLNQRQKPDLPPLKKYAVRMPLPEEEQLYYAQPIMADQGIDTTPVYDPLPPGYSSPDTNFEYQDFVNNITDIPVVTKRLMPLPSPDYGSPSLPPGYSSPDQQIVLQEPPQAPYYDPYSSYAKGGSVRKFAKGGYAEGGSTGPQRVVPVGSTSLPPNVVSRARRAFDAARSQNAARRAGMTRGLARAAEMSGRTVGRPANESPGYEPGYEGDGVRSLRPSRAPSSEGAIPLKKGGKVVEKGSGEAYASKAAMKRHEAKESAAKERAEHGKAMGGKMQSRDVVSRETKASPRSMMDRRQTERMRRYEGQRPNLTPMIMKKGGYAEGGKMSDLKQDKQMVKTAVHKHEKAMHPGKPMTKLRKGGMAC